MSVKKRNWYRICIVILDMFCSNHSVNHLFLAVIAVVSACFVTHHANGQNSTTSKAERHIAIQLVPTYQEPVTFSEVTVFEGEIRSIRHLTKRDFMMIASGNLSHPANPDQVNLFALYGLDDCMTRVLVKTKEIQNKCQCIDDLWKLRYQSHPMSDGHKPGWAGYMAAPSERQLTMLKSFGIDRLHTAIYGDNVFKLLIALSTPGWVAEYQE